MKIKFSIKPQLVKIHTPFIRLDALLKLASVTPSGGEAKIMIVSEKVKVNGEICTQRGKKLVNGDKVTVNGKIYEVSNEDNLAEL